jgi:RecB family exonuclease
VDDDWRARLEETSRKVVGAAGGAAEAQEILARFLSESPLRAYFERKEGRSVLTEFDVCDAAGRLFRLDRLVVDARDVTILDFKTGGSADPEADPLWDEEHRAQLRLYLQIVAGLFPGRKTRGLLAYLDRGTWEEVR